MTKKEELIKELKEVLENTNNSRAESITDKAVIGGSRIAFEAAIKLAEAIL